MNFSILVSLKSLAQVWKRLKVFIVDLSYEIDWVKV